MYHSQDKLRTLRSIINCKVGPSWFSTEESNKTALQAYRDNVKKLCKILVMKESRNLLPFSDILKQSLPVLTRAAKPVA